MNREKLNQEQIDKLLKLSMDPEMNRIDIARELNISKMTVYNYQKKYLKGKAY